MSVLSHLNSRASEAVLSEGEKNLINRSIANLQTKLDNHFFTVREHFQFGSSTRGTILPRRFDEHSDIDYMVVFEDGDVTPQAYLERLKRFVEDNYKTSEVYRSTPTIVLELSHIKFELVPALTHWWSGYKIPDRSGGWQSTDPNDFNESLTEKNKSNANLIKPTIRLMKLWNALNGYIYDSYSLEKLIVDQSFFWIDKNQKSFFFHVIDQLDLDDLSSQTSRNKVVRAKTIVAKAARLDSDYYADEAEAEIKKLMP